MMMTKAELLKYVRYNAWTVNAKLKQTAVDLEKGRLILTQKTLSKSYFKRILKLLWGAGGSVRRTPKEPNANYD